MRLPYTRAMVSAALRGDLNNIAMNQDPFFGLEIPADVPGVPADILQPGKTWQDKAAYETQVRALVASFRENFKQFESQVSPAVITAGPQG